jgi:hypothetical protein
MNGIGVSAAAAHADENARLNKELEAEKAKNDEDKMLERYSTGKCVSRLLKSGKLSSADD